MSVNLDIDNFISHQIEDDWDKDYNDYFEQPSTTQTTTTFKIKKASIKETLNEISNKLKASCEQWDLIKDEGDKIHYKELNQFQFHLYDFKDKCQEEQDSLGKIEPTLISILNRLGPARCKPTMKKGPERNKLRAEIIQQYSQLWIGYSSLEFLINDLIKNKLQLPQLLNLQEKIDKLWNKIRDFKGSANNVEKYEYKCLGIGVTYEYIRGDKKGDFMRLLWSSIEKFQKYYKEAVESKNKLKLQLDSLTTVPEETEFAEKLSFGSADQKSINIESFNKIRSQAILGNTAFKDKVLQQWKNTCVKVYNLQSKIEQARSTAKDPRMCIPWETTSAANMKKKYFLNPDINILEKMASESSESGEDYEFEEDLPFPSGQAVKL